MSPDGRARTAAGSTLSGDPRTPAAFAVTVDVEADNAWTAPTTLDLLNLKLLLRFQDLCDRYGILPTYLVTYECATRDDALSVLVSVARRGNCEIGHHLHVWTTPPFEQEGLPGIDTAWVQAYQSEIPDSLFREKAESLRSAIEQSFGSSPRSHRAGRWAIDARSLEWLAVHGFSVDSSVVPSLDFSRSMGNRQKGPSYRWAPLHPYVWALPGGTRMLEVPVTTCTPGKPVRDWLFDRLRGRSAASGWVGTRLYSIRPSGVPLRPRSGCRHGQLTLMAERALRGGARVLNFMLHSSELATGCSPSSSTDAATEEIWCQVEETFRYAWSKGLQRRRLGDLVLDLGGVPSYPPAALAWSG